jgi:hypothetical protein
VIGAGELRTSPLVRAVLAPDLDLEKANGKPGQDGVADALSAGFGSWECMGDLYAREAFIGPSFGRTSP